MTCYTGKDGSLTVDGTRLARAASWQISTSLELYDVSRVGDCEKKYKGGAKVHTGTATIWYDTESDQIIRNLMSGSSGQNSSPVSFVLGWGAGAFRFNAWLTDASVTCQVGAVTQAQISFQVEGELS